jgi:hypothetical protein
LKQLRLIERRFEWQHDTERRVDQVAHQLGEVDDAVLFFIGESRETLLRVFHRQKIARRGQQLSRQHLHDLDVANVVDTVEKCGKARIPRTFHIGVELVPGDLEGESARRLRFVKGHIDQPGHDEDFRYARSLQLQGAKHDGVAQFGIADELVEGVQPFDETVAAGGKFHLGQLIDDCRDVAELSGRRRITCTRIAGKIVLEKRDKCLEQQSQVLCSHDALAGRKPIRDVSKRRRNWP